MEGGCQVQVGWGLQAVLCVDEVPYLFCPVTESSEVMTDGSGPVGAYLTHYYLTLTKLDISFPTSHLALEATRDPGGMGLHRRLEN